MTMRAREADEMAAELHRLVDAYTDHGLTMEAAAELKQFLWDNKLGILRALETLAHGEDVSKS